MGRPLPEWVNGPMCFVLSIVANGEFVISPNWWLLALACCWLGLGTVTAAKGRWGWLLLGVLLGGLLWPISALLPAAPESLWDRVRRRHGQEAEAQCEHATR